MNPEKVDGVRAMLPVLIGVVPFALVTGAASVHQGLAVSEAVAFSLFAFSGAAQVTATQLMGEGASVPVVVATALVINLRFLFYSAALAPLLASYGARTRLAAAYVMTDHAFALTERRATRDRASPGIGTFYLAAALTFWCTWQVCNFLGALVEGVLPSDTFLTFAVPLSFLALLVPTLISRARAVACLAAAAVAVLLRGAPTGSNILIAIVVGIAAGHALRDRRATAGRVEES